MLWSKRAFQVLISVYNTENHIRRCFNSLDQSLKNEDWILLIGNDCSTDNTLLEIIEYIPQTTARQIHFLDYDKATTVGAAKNRLIEESHKYKETHPAILMMDADDEMTPERPKMIETAIEEQSKYVTGGWSRYRRKNEKWVLKNNKNSESAAKGLQFGPWATLFHGDFLPEDGKFFPEDEINNCGYEDLLTWHHLKHFSYVTPVPHKNLREYVHKYYIHEESVSNALDQNKVSFQRNTYWALIGIMEEENRDIFSSPPTEKEVTRGIAKYVIRKKYRNAVSQQRRSIENQSLVVPVHPLDELDLFKK